MGKNGFVWWQGVVEDRHDPLYLGRCRVRILGWHTENKGEMPTESLPWAYPVQPITSAAQTGVGISPTGPVEGTWVVGFFRDGEYGQEPVFFGTLGGIPDEPASEFNGFSDPRVVEPDDEHPFVLTNKKLLGYTGVDEEARVPRAPKSIRFYKANTIIPETESVRELSSTSTLTSDSSNIQVILEEFSTRSKYPDVNYLEEPTTPRLARGKFGNFPTGSPYAKDGIIAQKLAWRTHMSSQGYRVAENTTDKWNEPDPQAIYGAQYPYNHVHQSESGHIVEIDDTPGKERLHRYHRTGTYEEIGALGQRITKVVNEDFKINVMNDYHRVAANKYESIGGKKDVNISGDFFHRSNIFSVKTSSDVSFESPTSTFSVNAGNIILDASTGTITLKGRSFIFDRATAENTDKTKGNSSVKVGGKYSLRAGSIQMASRGSSGITTGGGYNLVATENIQESAANIIGGVLGTPARSFKAALGDIIFETALNGNINLNCGPSGLFASIEVSKIGEVTIKGGFGLSSITLGATGISLSYLTSSIDIGPAGVSISGLTNELNGTVQSKVTGALVNIEAQGINTVSGALVKIN